MKKPKPKAKKDGASPALSVTTGYAGWRSAPELRLAALEKAKWGHEQKIRELNRQIDSVTEELANGASGGTMWKRNLSFA